MWIRVRSMDGQKSVRVDGLSKLCKIEELREKLIDDFDAPPEKQRLFFRGKQVGINILDRLSHFDSDNNQQDPANGIKLMRPVVSPDSDKNDESIYWPVPPSNINYHIL